MTATVNMTNLVRRTSVHGEGKPMCDADLIVKNLVNALPENAHARDELIALGTVVVGVIATTKIEERSGLASTFCNLVMKGVALDLN